MPIIIENETHWRTPDIKRLVTAALGAAGADMSRRRTIKVVYNIRKRKKKRTKSSKGPTISFVGKVDYTLSIMTKETRVTLMMPKTGPRDLHSNAMVAIAAASAAPTDSALLSPKETFRLAHQLAYSFSGEASAATEQAILRDNFHSSMPPAWCDASKLLICKVKDPLKDGTYLAFVAKKETVVKRAETAIEKEVAAVEAAKRRLKSARDRKKKAEQALRSARERRA